MKSLCISLVILASGISNLIAQTNGIDQTLNFIAPPTGGKFVSWHAKTGRSYFLQVSDPTAHLHKWNWSTVIERGQNQTISYEVDSTADKGFFRLHYTDQTATNLETADFDNDGLTNLQEITPYILPGTNAPRSIGGAPAPNSTQTNPLNGDTDGDGLSDKFERDNNLDGTDDGSRNPNNGPNGDPDGDGISNIDQQTAENTPKPNLSTELVYRGALYAEQQFDFGAYAQTTLYSKSLVDFHTADMQKNSVMKAPDIRVAATINVDSAYIQPTHPDDPQQAYSTPGDFKSYFKTNFPIPPLSTTDDLSTWKSITTALNFGLTYRDILPNFLFIDANEAIYEFAVRAAESSTTERQEKRTLLQVLKTTNTSNPSNPVVTYSTITPATRELTFTIPAGKKTSASQRISTPVAQIAGTEDHVKELILLPVEIKISSANSPTGSAPKYTVISETPKHGNADNLFSVWQGEDFTVKVKLPVSFQLPQDFIKWNVLGENIPANAKEHTFNWTAVGTKRIEVQVGESKFEIWVDVPYVGNVGQGQAIATMPPWATAQIGGWAVFAQDYCNTHYPVSPKRDAIRHSYWCALSVSDGYVTEDQIIYFSTAHEFDNKWKDTPRQQAFNSVMDLWNNFTGTTVDISYPTLPPTPNITQILQTLEQKYTAGELRRYDGNTSESASEGIILKSNGTKIYPGN